MAVMSDTAHQIAKAASEQMLKFKQANKNYLGEDIDAETLSLMDAVQQGTEVLSQVGVYETAQLKELAFWRQIAFDGYAGDDPRAFPWFQKLFMLNCFMRTLWSLGELKDRDVIEIGCGPLGMIEFLPGRRKIGCDPLTPHYAKLYCKARSGAVEYICDVKELLKSERDSFDLGICFNVLDHVLDPKGLLDSLMSFIKSGGRFLVQVNTVKEGSQRSEEHKAMHPSPIKADDICGWLSDYSQDYEKMLSNDPTPENEYFFMAWGYKK